MSENVLDIPKPYHDDSALTEEMLDTMFNEIESWATVLLNDFKQLKLDCFKLGYSLDGDGNANLTKPIQDTVSFPDTLVFFDDFMESNAILASTFYSKTHWTGAGTAGTQAIVAGVGGFMRLDTTAAASSTSTLSFTSSNFDVLYAPKIEFSLKTSNITNTKINAGFYASANDYVMFEFDTADNANNIYLVSKNNGGSEISTDTGVDLAANSFKKFKIELSNNGSISAYINDSLVATNHTGNVNIINTIRPYFYVDNKAAAESKKLDIDYVRIIQNRA